MSCDGDRAWGPSMQDSRRYRAAGSLDGVMVAAARAADRRAVVAFLDSCLRGVGQVIFMNNPVSGALIFAGIWVASPWMFVCTLVGLVAATGTAVLLRQPCTAVRAGLFGYNGALVGAAVSVFLQPAWSGELLALASGGGAASVIVTMAWGRTIGRSGIPALTFPFNLVALPLLWLWLPGPGASEAASAAARAGLWSTSTAAEGLFRGISQLFLADGVIAGLLILAGIFVCSRIAGITALVGAAVGGLVGTSLGADPADIQRGLWGYNAYVTAVAIAGIFLVPSRGSALSGLAAAVAATLVFWTLSPLLGQWGLPALTLPFCIATAATLLLARAAPWLQFVPLEEITTPEQHAKRRALPISLPIRSEAAEQLEPQKRSTRPSD